LEEKLTGIELLKGGSGLTSLEEAGHKELVPLTLEVEARHAFVQLDTEGTCEVPSAHKPGMGSDFEREHKGGTKGAEETDLKFQLYE
jgi:hypothetical protein